MVTRNAPSKSLRVALVEMPFGPVAWPSIGTSLLKSQLIRAGHDCRVLYLNHWFLPYLGRLDRAAMELYHAISDAFGPHLGEWIFVRAAFPGCTPSAADDREYLTRLAGPADLSNLVDPARRLRGVVPAYLQECLDRMAWNEYDVVGFANSFSQLNASLALARGIHERCPDTPMIMGGCGCSDVMGSAVLRMSPLLKAVAVSEADHIIVEMVEAVHEGSDEGLAAIPGIVFHDAGGAIRSGPPKERLLDLNALPYPDYDDYYEFRPEGIDEYFPFYIPLESSRGCWWGQKSHCTFCGLNPDRMTFYHKEPQRFLDEIGFLAKRYKPPRFMCVDNIMPRRYYDEMVPQLPDYSGGAEVFFEIKSNFRREQLAAFRRANIRQVQPGIESLSTPVLQLMGKGVTAVANIYTLRLCQEFDIRAHWAILFGFGSERLEHYLVTAELIRRIMHLRPPLNLVRVEVERFAPMFRLPDENGLKNVRPSDWYRFCYPVSDEILGDLAYRFDTDYIDRSPGLTEDIERRVRPLVRTWQAGYGDDQYQLQQIERNGNVVILRRAGDQRIEYHLDSGAAALYEELQTPRYVQALLPQLSRSEGYEPYLDDVFLRRAAAAWPRGGGIVAIAGGSDAQIYTELLIHGLVVEEGGQAVAVACYPGEVARRLANQQQVTAATHPFASPGLAATPPA